MNDKVCFDNINQETCSNDEILIPFPNMEIICFSIVLSISNKDE